MLATQSSRKSTTGLVAQIGSHTVKSGSTLHSELDSTERWRSGVLHSVERRSSWTIPEICVPDSSTSNSLTDRLGAGQRTKHIDTRVLLDTRTSPRRRPQYQEGAYSEQLRRCWNEASLCFSTFTTVQVCRIGILLNMDPTLQYKMKADEAYDGSGEGLQTRYEHRDLI